MGHAHTPLAGFVDQRQAREQGRVFPELGPHHCQMPLVDLEDDVEMTRQHTAHHFQWPGFKRLGHQGVIGIGEDARAHRPGIGPFQAMHVEQQTHQFRHGNGRMGIVQMHRDLVRQLLEVDVLAHVARQDVLHRRAGEEELLTQPQFAALIAGIVGVEHTRDVFREILGAHRAHVIALIEQRKVERLGGLGMPQAQRTDGACAMAGHDDVVGHRQHHLGVDPMGAVFVASYPAAEADFIGGVGAREFPRVPELQPVVGLLDLITVQDTLREHAVVVADAVADARQAERRHGIQEARREASQTTVTERRIGLLLAHFFEIDTKLAHSGRELVI